MGCIHQSGNAQHGIRAKHQRINISVVHPPIQHIHPLWPFGGAHEKHVGMHEEIGAFHQLDAQLVGQKAVFVIGAVVNTRRQQGKTGLAVAAVWRYGFQRIQQCVRIGFHRADSTIHPQFRNDFRHQAQHHLAVFQHVGNPGRRPRIVFQHIEIVSAGANQINAGDMHPHIFRRATPHLRQSVLRIEPHQFFRNNSGLHALARAIDISEEHVQRCHPLDEPLFQPCPFRAGNDARHNIKRNQPLGSIRIAIDCKGNPDSAEKQFRLPPAGFHQFVAGRLQPFANPRIGRAHIGRAKSCMPIHFIKSCVHAAILCVAASRRN